MPERLAEGSEGEEAGSFGARERFLLGAGSLLAATLIRLVRWSNRVEYHGREVLESLRQGGERFILAFWHEQLFLMPYVYPGPRITVMVSRHRDGEWIARTVARFGVDSTRGSTTSGASGALRALVRKVRGGYDGAFTPDGPKGPRRRVQQGVVLAARLSGAPILPVALGCSRARRLRSWDRFLIPLPFGRVAFVYGSPLRVPPDSGEREMADAGTRLEQALDEVTYRAESLAAGTP